MSLGSSRPTPSHRRVRIRTVALLSIVVVLACGGCARKSRRRADAAFAPARASVVTGRIQIVKAGEDAPVGPQAAPIIGWIVPAKPLTTVVFTNLQSGLRVSVDVIDDAGWYAIGLPPGRYGIGLRYDVFVTGTPARIDIPEAGRRYYIGTLEARLFDNGTTAAAVTSAFGGVVPDEEVEYAVYDDFEGYSSNRFEKRLMSLSPTVTGGPLVETRR